MTSIIYKIKILVGLVCLSLLFGCEDIIDFPLKESQKLPVIDAEFDMYTGICMVKVSQTQSLLNKEPSPVVSGLEVSIQYDNTKSKIFIETEKGTYQSEKFMASPGKTYTLIIKNLMGQEYRAKAVAPNLILPIVKDSVIKYTSNGIDVAFEWNDPQNQENYYWPILTVNKVPQKSWDNITSDNGRNGNTMFANLQVNAMKSDEIGIQLQSLDADSFRYYQQLINLSFGGQLPYNSKNNFDKPAAGVFRIINYKPIKLTLK
jgi:hypothetical protein